MEKNQIMLIKYNKLPVILDNECNLLLQKDKFSLKPHDHGDIHYLLYQSGSPKNG